MNFKKIKPKFSKKKIPRIGLIVLSTDYVIENDFSKVTRSQDINLFVNRIKSFNPLSQENLIKMSKNITEVSNNILPKEKIDCMVYACTSGTIAAGFRNIEKKIKLAKPSAKVTTPSSAALKALKKLGIKRLSIFTPYSKKLNNEVVEFFRSKKFQITSNYYFDIASDENIWKVNQNYLYNVLSKMDHGGSDALFISCTTLPVMRIIEKLEKKLGKYVLSSNQVLIWDTLVNIKKNKSIHGFGKLFLKK